MNKATLLHIINEELAGTYTKLNGSMANPVKEKYGIYKNPTSKDWNALLNEKHSDNDKLKTYYNNKLVRFIVDVLRKDVYVHNASILHHQAANVVELPDFFPNSRRYFSGTAKVDGGRMTIVNSDNLDIFVTTKVDKEYKKDLKRIDWTFTQRYFDTDIAAYLERHRATGRVKNLQKVK